mmetsp:Transcript_30095/g.82687  ORF Transcript_30095/g.82687 Transcript_30095/m.82687 type:complete len:490 (-) Transcript_30095:318-1787(-)
MPLLLAQASRLTVCSLKPGFGGAQVHVELVVLLLNHQDLVLQLPHLVRNLLDVRVDGSFGLVVGTLLVHVLHLHLLEALSHRPERLDLRSELILLLLQLRVDLLYDRRDLVEGLALGPVNLRLLDRRLLELDLGLAPPRGCGVLRLQDLLRPDEYRNLVPQVAQLRLQPLELRRLVAQGSRVGLELVTLHELVPFHLFVLALLLGQILAECVELLLELLLVLEDKLLLSRHEVRLLLVDGKPGVLILLVHLLLERLDLFLHALDLTLHRIDVRLRDWRFTQRPVDLPEPMEFLLALFAHAVQSLLVFRGLAAQHLKHRLRVALAVLLLGLPQLPEPRRAFDVHLLRLFKLVALLHELLSKASLFLLLFAQQGSDLQEHVEALVFFRLRPQMLDLLGELLPLRVQLCHLPLQVGGVHATLPFLLDVGVRGFELGLELLVRLIDLANLLVPEELLGHIEVHAELGQVRPLLQRLEVVQEPVQNRVHSVLLA